MINFDNRAQSMEMICEECTSNEFFDGDFRECIAAAKVANWIVRNITGSWLHFCSMACEARWTKKNMKDEIE
jgi:hypothetical protein